jgi:hypothetical protein
VRSSRHVPIERKHSGDARGLDITPSPQKGTKKTYEIIFIARGTKHYAQLKGNKKNLVGFFGTFLGRGRDMLLID